MNRYRKRDCPRSFLAVLFLFAVLADMKPLLAQSAGKPEVLIWYVNETAPDPSESQSWDTIIGWLRSSDNPKCRKIAGQLESDRVKFPAAIDEELAVLRERLPTGGLHLGAAIFTNRSVRQGKFLLLTAGDSAFREAPIIVPGTEKRVLATSPLARPEVLALCLREVARRFDPGSHEFILITSSHGNPTMALTPRLTVRAEETNREELLAVAAGETPEERLPAWARARLGITKDDFFATLGQLGEQEGMQFSLVFIEACKGVLDDHVTVRPPLCIRRLYMTGASEAKYQNLDYAALLVPQSPPVPLSDTLDVALAAKFPALVRGDPPPSATWRTFRLLLYWLPLILLAGWLVFRRLRRRPLEARSDADSSAAIQSGTTAEFGGEPSDAGPSAV